MNLGEFWGGQDARMGSLPADYVTPSPRLSNPQGCLPTTPTSHRPQITSIPVLPLPHSDHRCCGSRQYRVDSWIFRRYSSCLRIGDMGSRPLAAMSIQRPAGKEVNQSSRGLKRPLFAWRLGSICTLRRAGWLARRPTPTRATSTRREQPDRLQQTVLQNRHPPDDAGSEGDGFIKKDSASSMVIARLSAGRENPCRFPGRLPSTWGQSVSGPGVRN